MASATRRMNSSASSQWIFSVSTVSTGRDTYTSGYFVTHKVIAFVELNKLKRSRATPFRFPLRKIVLGLPDTVLHRPHGLRAVHIDDLNGWKKKLLTGG